MFSLKLTVAVAHAVFLAYDVLQLNKLKIYRKLATGRGLTSVISCSFTKGPFITLQNPSLSIIHLTHFIMIIHLMCPPRTLKLLQRKNTDSQGEIYEGVINIIVLCVSQDYQYYLIAPSFLCGEGQSVHKDVITHPC